MELKQFVDEATLGALNRLFPGRVFEPIVEALKGSKGSSVYIDLPAPTRAEYFFRLYFIPERQIHARLISLKTDYSFWYRPFEDAEFRNSVERLDKAFFETVERVVFSETRIIQTRGLLFESFECDYKCESSWKRIYKYSVLRIGGFKVPPVESWQRIYYSPPLSSA